MQKSQRIEHWNVVHIVRIEYVPTEKVKELDYIKEKLYDFKLFKYKRSEAWYNNSFKMHLNKDELKDFYGEDIDVVKGDVFVRPHVKVMFSDSTTSTIHFSDEKSAKRYYMAILEKIRNQDCLTFKV